MTAGAAGLIGGDRTAKTVDHMALAQGLPGNRVVILPGPVEGLLQLFGRFRVAAQTGFGDFGAAIEGALERLEAGVIRR